MKKTALISALLLPFQHMLELVHSCLEQWLRNSVCIEGTPPILLCETSVSLGREAGWGMIVLLT